MLFVKPHSAFLLQMSLIALRFSQFVQCMVPVFLFYLFFWCLVTGVSCVHVPNFIVLLMLQARVGFISSSPESFSPRATVFLDNMNSAGVRARAHTHNLPRASFLPDLVRGHVSALCAISLQRPGRAINKYILTSPDSDWRLGTLGADWWPGGARRRLRRQDTNRHGKAFGPS